MSSVLHPVGPESSQTYWIRRIAVVAMAILVLTLIVSAVASAARPDAVTAGPNGSGPQVAPSPGGEPTPTPGAAEDAFTSAPTPTVTTTTPTPATTPARRSRTASPAGPDAKPTPLACRPNDLRATLAGKRSVKARTPTTFSVSLINTGTAPCVMTVTPATFELRIYSGIDRIWSTKDCSRLLKPVTKKVASQDALEWQVRWDGRRSLAECKRRPEMPRPGTYIATVDFEGVAPVQLWMTILA